MMVNEQKMNEVMLDLGHRDNVRGTEYLRAAMRIYKPGISMTKELYPEIAKGAKTTAARVERCMRHSIATAWGRGSWDMQRRYFGYGVNPQTGVPTVGEWLARMERLCREN